MGADRGMGLRVRVRVRADGVLETAHRHRGRQHEGEQRCSGDADAGLTEVQLVDCIVLPQPLHRNPVHPPRRRAGHSREQQLVWRLTLALDAAAQGIAADGSNVVLVLLLLIIIIVLRASGEYASRTACTSTTKP